MKRRRVPNTISKRLRRKLARSSNPYFLWLRCRRPVYWARLQRWWGYQLRETLTHIAPIDTPFFSSLPRISTKMAIQLWEVDPA